MHENVHGGQNPVWMGECYLNWKAGITPYDPEVDAYNMELQHAEENGLNKDDIIFITAWRDYYNNNGPKPGQ